MEPKRDNELFEAARRVIDMLRKHIEITVEAVKRSRELLRSLERDPSEPQG
jgi:hypothetical protein